MSSCGWRARAGACGGRARRAGVSGGGVSGGVVGVGWWVLGWWVAGWSRLRVWGPAIPSMWRCRAVWNRVTARSVRGPYLPSIGPGGNPAWARCRCRDRTCPDPPGTYPAPGASTWFAVASAAVVCGPAIPSMWRCRAALEPGDGLFGPGAVFAVDRPGAVAQAGEAALERPHRPGAVDSAVARSGREQRPARRGGGMGSVWGVGGVGEGGERYGVSDRGPATPAHGLPRGRGFDRRDQDHRRRYPGQGRDRRSRQNRSLGPEALPQHLLPAKPSGAAHGRADQFTALRPRPW